MKILGNVDGTKLTQNALFTLTLGTKKHNIKGFVLVKEGSAVTYQSKPLIGTLRNKDKSVS